MFGKTLLYLIAAGLTTSYSCPQNVRQPEQAVFTMEQEVAPIRKPVDIPAQVLDILRKTEFVARSVEPGQSPSDIPARWFVGSEIRLNGSNKIDLIVLPRELDSVPAENRRLIGANVASFWIFRKTAAGYSLVFDESVHDLEVLESRTNGYRDIRTTSATAVSVTTLLFRFNGEKYELYRRETKEERKRSSSSIRKTT